MYHGEKMNDHRSGGGKKESGGMGGLSGSYRVRVVICRTARGFEMKGESSQ